MKLEIQGGREKLRLTHPGYREQKYTEERRSSNPLTGRDFLSEAGSPLSLEEQVEYHNKRTGPLRDEEYCTIFVLR